MKTNLKNSREINSAKQIIEIPINAEEEKIFH
jgi:hypothetical protein